MEYYINPETGSNDNNGTSIEQPWKTIQYALGRNKSFNLGSGDIVNLMGGIYKESFITIYVAKFENESDPPLTIKNLGNSDVIIDGQFQWRELGLQWHLADATSGTYYMDIPHHEIPHHKYASLINSHHIKVTGTFQYRGKSYSLIPYSVNEQEFNSINFNAGLNNLTNSNEKSSLSGYYAGPGTVYVKLCEDYSRIYIRLQAPDSRFVLGQQNTFALDNLVLNPNDELVNLSIVINPPNQVGILMQGLAASEPVNQSYHFEGILDGLREDPFNADVKDSYTPGWEANGIEGNPCLDNEYHPIESMLASTSGVDISMYGFPGVTSHLNYRGAFSTTDSE